MTGAPRGPGLFPLLPCPADRYLPEVGRPVYVPEQDRECWPVPRAPPLSLVPGALPRGCSSEPEPGSVRAAVHCIYCAFRGFCRSPAATREIFLFPLCCITWLLFSCCCFFPPASVDVGCGQGQVTGQDVLPLRRYRHGNK